MGIILLVVLLYVVPTECTDHTEAYGLKLSNPQNGLRFARQESTEMIACAAIDSEPYLTSGRHTSNQFCAFCRMTRSVYTLCGFRNINPVGFCVVCVFCGNFSPHYSKAKNAMRTSLRLLRKGLTK